MYLYAHEAHDIVGAVVRLATFAQRALIVRNDHENMYINTSTNTNRTQILHLQREHAR